HCYHFIIVRLELVCLQQEFNCLIETLYLVFKSGSIDLRFEVIGLLASLLHRRLYLGKDCLRILWITALNWWMVGRQTLITGHSCRRAWSVLLIHAAGKDKAYDEAQQHTDEANKRFSRVIVIVVYLN